METIFLNKFLKYLSLALMIMQICCCGYLNSEVIDLNPPPQPSPQLAKMIYKTIEQRSDGSVIVSFLSGTGIIFNFDPTVSSEVRTAEIKIYLKTDWTYEVKYIEFLGNLRGETLTLTGQYSENEQGIVFSDLGVGSIIEVNRNLQLLFKFSRDINTPGLANKEILLRIANATIGNVPTTN
jgi:hypothetical protein